MRKFNKLKKRRKIKSMRLENEVNKKYLSHKFFHASPLSKTLAQWNYASRMYHHDSFDDTHTNTDTFKRCL